MKNLRYTRTAIAAIALALFAASLMSSAADAAKSAGNNMSSAQAGMARIGGNIRANEVRAPNPTAKKAVPPCKGHHCHWQHQH